MIDHELPMRAIELSPIRHGSERIAGRLLVQRDHALFQVDLVRGIVQQHCRPQRRADALPTRA